MSGDVQPRKRKDKKKKRDSLDRKSEGDLVFSRKSSLQPPEEDEVVHHGVHATKMTSDDIHLHVQSASSTGGNWCAKIFFFSLLAILVGLVGLIILENRGLSDLDTPLSESKYKEYFEGWVDEHRQSHNDPHDVINHEIEEHEEHDEPFEEEALEVSEENEEEEDDDADDDHNENQSETAEEEAEENEENIDSDVEDEEIAESKNESEQQLGSVEEEEEDEENDDNDDEEDNDDDVSSPNPLEDDDQDEDEEQEEEPEQDDIVEEQIVRETVKSNEASKSVAPDDDPFDEHDTNSNKIFSNSEFLKDELTDKQLQFKIENKTQSNNREEYDTTLESLEDHIIENDNDEIRLLQAKAKLSQKNSQNVNDQEEESTTSNFAVKIVIGLALALVARLVLIKKDAEDDINKNVPADCPEQSSEIITQRRLTIAPDDLPYDEIIDDDSYENDEKVYSESDGEEYVEEIIEIEIEDDQDDEFQNENVHNSLLDESTRKTDSYSLANLPNTKVKAPDIGENIFRPIEKRIENQEQVAPVNVKFQMPQATPNVISKPERISPNLIYKNFASEKKETNSDEEDEVMEEEEIEEEILEEEEEEEDDDEEMSEVDDSDLMARLEQKYGKIPFDADAAYESEEEDVEGQSWTNIKPKSGGQQYEDELKEASEEMAQNNFKSALKIYEKLVLNHPNIPEVHYGKADTLDKLSKIYKSNQMLSEAIESYKRFLAFDELIENNIFNETANRCIERMRFLGLYKQAVNIHDVLIKRFPENSKCLNELVVTYMLSNSPHHAKKVLELLLKKWPTDGFAQVHYGFILKNSEKNLVDAVEYLQRGIESEADGTQDGRFYFHLGDALQRLGRETEAFKIHKKGVEKKLFLSEYQRSLYNVKHLKSKPFWNKIETTYDLFFTMLESNWIHIRNEGLDVLNEKGYFVDEAESLKDTGDWKQFELFARGIKNKQNCLKTPITCKLIDAFPAARFCSRGQTKFSVMHPNTHVWPHCGPTNCRIRAHLGLKVPHGTTIRVANDKRTWDEGKFLIFDDSFEHEVWHNGTDLRLVLIVDVWHPDLTADERNTLAPI